MKTDLEIRVFGNKPYKHGCGEYTLFSGSLDTVIKTNNEEV